jgi:hypothetical protein
MAVPSEHTRQRGELVDTLRTQSKECAAAARESSGFPATLLKDASEMADELAGYLSSPIVDDAISTFRESAEARKEARGDLTAYLRKAGLEVSDRAKFELRDNNWCAQLVLTVLSEGHSHSVGGHYDSGSGWGAGACP